MSNQSWMISLRQRLRQENKPLPAIAVVGIGQELRGDDAAGVIVARRLQETATADLLVIDAGPVPENFTGTLCRFNPDILILVDAVQMNASPGTIRLLKIDDAQFFNTSTHTLSLHLLIDYLQAILDCEMLLLGIQPGQNAFAAEMSSAVETSVEHVVRALKSNCHIS